MPVTFKHVGKTVDDLDVVRNVGVPERRPLGVITPLRPGGIDGVFAMHTEPAAIIRDNLRNLILTNSGERVMRPDLGADLRPLTMEYTNSEDFEAEAMTRIKRTVTRYMPFVELGTFDVKRDGDVLATGRLRIVITYDVPSLGLVDQSLTLDLRIGG